MLQIPSASFSAYRVFGYKSDGIITVWIPTASSSKWKGELREIKQQNEKSVRWSITILIYSKMQYQVMLSYIDELNTLTKRKRRLSISAESNANLSEQKPGIARGTHLMDIVLSTQGYISHQIFPNEIIYLVSNQNYKVWEFQWNNAYQWLPFYYLKRLSLLFPFWSKHHHPDITREFDVGAIDFYLFISVLRIYICRNKIASLRFLSFIVPWDYLHFLSSNFGKYWKQLDLITR